MRLLSIVALFGVVYATYVPSGDSESFGKRAVCPAGQGDNGRGGCATCSAGTFGIGGASPCQSCTAGTTSTVGASACNMCSPGYYRNPSRTTSSDPMCMACPAGQISGNNANSCTPCLPNTYSANPGSSMCSPCSAGLISAAGSTSCYRSCPAGQAPSGNSCSDCRAGTYSTVGSASCTNCPVGYVSDAKASSCAACLPGLVPDPNGKTCSVCRANTYASNGVCTPCPAGQTSPAGATTCTPQPSGPPVPPVRRAQMQCTSQPGYKWCPVLSGRGGNECVNTLTAVDSCGGCMAPEGEEDEYSGRDCTQIPNVQDAKCQQGRCKIMSCMPGYSAGQGVCAPTPGHSSKARRAAILHARHDTF